MAARETEEGTLLRPRFDGAGLVTAIAQDARTRDVLMVAHVNAEALRLTVETGYAHYWSRSRGALWKKGETSGQLQRVREIRVDCDQDAVLMLVEVAGDGGACHTGRRSCFYRALSPDGRSLAFIEAG
jgi:phosphoribosyl-AMP cyclohydrolase